MTAMKRKGIRKQPPRTPKLTANVQVGLAPRAIDYETIRAARNLAAQLGLFRPAKPTLRQRWVSWVNSLGGKLLRYGR